MEPLPPTTFPRKVKRFQSLSMTPLDYQTDFQHDHLNNPVQGSNKFNFSAATKTPLQQSSCQVANTVTNQFSFKNRKRLFQIDNSNIKATLKAQIGSTKQINNAIKTPTFLSNYTHRKMISSQIFDSNSINGKNYQTSKKTYLSSGMAFKNGERGSFQSQQQGQNQQGKKRHIPSFLLNKKRTPRSSEIQDSIPRQMYESTPLSLCQTRQQRWKTFKDQIIINSTKSIESDSIEVFSPPNQKIAYSKATASTLCTSLPREQSRQTFKDFDEMQELKEMSNSMQDSDSSPVLHRQFDNLFRKQETGIGGNLEDQIAQLFSDEDAESEQYNHELQSQLEQLF